MKAKPGRKTSGDLGAVKATTSRPEPPPDLSDKQSDIWREVTSGLPAKWFGNETLGLLKSYCRHMDSFEGLSRRIEERIDTMRIDALDRFLKARERESRIIVNLATKMRITQQATYDKEKRKAPGPGKPPWPTPYIDGGKQ